MTALQVTNITLAFTLKSKQLHKELHGTKPWRYMPNWPLELISLNDSYTTVKLPPGRTVHPCTALSLLFHYLHLEIPAASKGLAPPLQHSPAFHWAEYTRPKDSVP